MKSTMIASTGQAPFRPTLLRALRLAMRDLWDHLGFVISFSLLHSLLIPLLLSVPLSLTKLIHLPPKPGYLLLTLLALPIFPPLFAGYCFVAYRICLGRSVSWAYLLQGFRQHYWAAVRLGLFQLVITFGLLANLLFYTYWHHPFGSLFSLFWAYILLCWSLLLLYQYPLLVLQENGVFDEESRRARRGALAAIRRSFFLTLGNPLYTVGLLCITALLVLLCFLTGIAWILLYPALPLQLVTRATCLLLARYDLVPPPPKDAPVADAPWHVETKSE